MAHSSERFFIFLINGSYENSSKIVAAFSTLGCSGWGRVDFMIGDDGLPQVIEINTVPGMTSHSLVPMAAKAFDIDFPELCWRVLETSIGEKPEVDMGVAANDA